MSLLGKGAVAIWHDVPRAARADYFEWHNREHMLERVSIPGFLRGRRYVALDGAPEFFTLYETESLDVLTGPHYMERLNNPTEWTRRVAPQIFNNVRSLCTVAVSIGSGVGGLVATLCYDVSPGSEAKQRALVESAIKCIVERPGITGAHLCIGDVAASSVQTAEKKTRPTKARTPSWVVLVEGGADRASLEGACAELLPIGGLAHAGAVDLSTGLYQLQFLPLQSLPK
jgi:hypothetical protein